MLYNIHVFSIYSVALYKTVVCSTMFAKELKAIVTMHTPSVILLYVMLLLCKIHLIDRIMISIDE